MSRLVDPTICPDCRAPLDPAARCTACGIHFSGADAAGLWRVMHEADGLVERLRRTSRLEDAMAARSASSPVATTVSSGGHGATTAVLPPVEPAPVPPRVPPVPPLPLARRPPAPAPRRLPALSVPVVLLSLGALCLLVAAVVFVAVTWGSLGLTGRTLVLLGVTGLLSGVAVVLTRRGLRGAAETFWTIVAAMLALDLLAAESAGLAGLDALGWRETGVLVGGSVLVLGTAVALLARRTPVRTLLAPQVHAVGGALLATLTGAWLAGDPAVGAALVVPVLAAAALPLRHRLPVLGLSLLGLAGLSWLELAGIGLERSTEQVALAAWWADLRGWPLALAAAYAGATTLGDRLPARVRPVAAALALAPLAVLVNSPATPGAETRDMVLRSATLLALAALVRLAARPWAMGAAALAAIGVVVLGLQLVLTPWTAIAVLPATGPADLAVPTYSYAAASWVYAVLGLVVAVTLLAALRLAPDERRAGLRDAAVVLGTAVAAAGLAGAVVGAQVPLWAAVGALLLAALVTAAVTWRTGRPSSLPLAGGLGALAAAYLAVETLAAARPTDLLGALAATALAVALAAACARSDRTPGTRVTPVLTAVAAVALGAYAAATWCDVAGAGARTTALVLAGLAVAVAPAAQSAARRTTTRPALEAAAAGVALASLVLSPGTSTTADALLLVGSALAVLAVLVDDRANACWATVALLGAATMLRVEEGLGHAPELLVLPAALVLALGGGLRRRTGEEGDPVADSRVHAGVALGVIVLLAVLAAAPLDRLAAVETTLVALAAAALLAWQERVGAELAAPPAGALTVLLGGTAVLGWGQVLDAEPALVSVLVAAYAALVVLLAAPLTRATPSRVALEGAALVVGLGGVVIAPDESAAALALTLLGTAAALLAVLHRDRDLVGWGAPLLLALATWLRLEAGDRGPELYVVPALALLLGHGLLRARRGGRSGRTTVGSGLALGYLAVLALAADGAGDALAVTSATLLALALGAVLVLLERTPSGDAAWTPSGPVAAVLAAMSGAVAVDAWTTLLDATGPHAAVAQAVWAGTAGVLAALVARSAVTRVVLEATAGVLALAAALAVHDEAALATVLTVVGTAVAVVAVTNRDRVQAGWIGAVLLGSATVIRVAVDVRAPELYTLPAALLLVGAGLWRLRTDREVSSLTALGSGLTLALVPSLLLALEDPVSVRGALIGVGGVVVLALGVRQRLAAPFVLGAATTAVLAVRHLQPVDAALPRWVSLALVGLALLVVGVTWEARLRNLRAAKRYLTALR